MCAIVYPRFTSKDVQFLQGHKDPGMLQNLGLAFCSRCYTQMHVHASYCSDNAIQVIGILLTRHVLKNYSSFVQGINDIAELQDELVGTLARVKATRQYLVSGSEGVSLSLRVCQSSEDKYRIGEVLHILEKMQRTIELGSTLRFVS